MVPTEAPCSKLRGITELNFEDFSEAEANPAASCGECSSSIESSPVGPHLDVKDVEVAAQKAIQAGLKVIRPIADQSYGERSGKFVDPFVYLLRMSRCIKKRKAADWVSQERGMMRRSCLAKL